MSDGGGPSDLNNNPHLRREIQTGKRADTESSGAFKFDLEALPDDVRRNIEARLSVTLHKVKKSMVDEHGRVLVLRPSYLYPPTLDDGGMDAAGGEELEDGGYTNAYTDYESEVMQPHHYTNAARYAAAIAEPFDFRRGYFDVTVTKGYGGHSGRLGGIGFAQDHYGHTENSGYRAGMGGFTDPTRTPFWAAILGQKTQPDRVIVDAERASQIHPWTPTRPLPLSVSAATGEESEDSDTEVENEKNFNRCTIS